MPLDEIGAGPSIGSVADSYDALSETTRRLYNAECVCGPGTAGCDDVDQLNSMSQATSAIADSMTSVTACGREIMITCEPSSSVMVAPARSA